MRDVTDAAEVKNAPVKMQLNFRVKLRKLVDIYWWNESSQYGELFVFSVVRIVDGTDTEGRLQVFLFDDWRDVCITNFDDTEANVACKELGFGYVVRMQLFRWWDNEHYKR